MATATHHLLRLSLSPYSNTKTHLLPFTTRNVVVSTPILFKPRPFISAKSPDFKPSSSSSAPPLLLDVSGMMCGACASRVKSILLSNSDRVDSAVVNVLTETAAIRLKETRNSSSNNDNNNNNKENENAVAEELAERLTECGFPSKRRVSGLGVEEKVRKWKEGVAKKEAMLVESRNRVVFAWTLVALCCGSHATHLLHLFGLHFAHGILYFSLYNYYYYSISFCLIW